MNFIDQLDPELRAVMERLPAYFGLDAGGLGTVLDHAVSVRLGEGSARKPLGAAADGAEQRPLGIIADPSLVDIRGQVAFKIVVAGHGVGLAAFFAQTDPEPPAFRVDVLDPHRERGADARERIHHQR